MAKLDEFIAEMEARAAAAGVECGAASATIQFTAREPGLDKATAVQAKHMAQSAISFSVDHILSLDAAAMRAEIDKALAPVGTDFGKVRAARGVR